MRKFFALFSVLVLSTLTLQSSAHSQESQPEKSQDQGLPSKLDGLDTFIEEVMKEWKVPGLAIAVVQDGKVIHAKGYGFRDVEKQLPVTEKTIFAIGSVSKSFTVTGLGMLADEGKLDWDKPVRSYLPDFQLFDKIATEQMTTRDLVTHRSGLPRHDFVWYGDPQLGRKELFGRLRHLEPNKEFRSTWQYQNLMFTTAGYLAEQIAGTSWEEFTRKRIMEPLGMENTNFSVNDSAKAADFALPYTKVKDDIKQIPFHNIDAVGPAGSINSNVDAMIRFVQFHIKKGTHNGKQLLSLTNAEQMQTPQMVMPANPQATGGEELGDMSYGMGFMISTYRGTKYVEHGGGIDGFISLLSFLPRKKAGVIVLTNMSGSNPAPTIITRNAYDRLLGLEPVDWAGRLRNQLKSAQAAAEAAKKKGSSDRKENTAPSHALADFAGNYQHAAYGTIKIEHDGSTLKLTTSGGVSTPIHHYHYDIFESDEDPTGRFDQRKVAFTYNKKGDIDRVAIAFEPTVNDIVFTRVPDESMRQKSFLEPLAGDYQIGLQPITIALKNDSFLQLTVPGQPSYELVPTRDTSFDLKGLNGFSVTFKKDDSGSVSEVVFYQPNGTFVAKRKTPPGAIAAKPPAANGKTSEPSKAVATTWSPELMMNLKKVGNVRPSPDGRRVVYTITSAVMTSDRSEHVAQIHLANADGGNSVQLTYGDKSSSDPQWAPDGQSLAFLSDRAGKNNLYLLRTSGGEAEQLTELKSGIASFAWSPDGKQIAFTMADPPSDDADKTTKGKTDWRWLDDEPKMNRLYVISVQAESPGKRQPRKLTTGAYHVAVSARAGASELDWSPDGKTIVFTHRKTPKADDWTTSDVSIVDVAGGEVKPLAATPASEFGAVYSPDGKSIAMLVSDNPPTWGGSYTIQIVPADGGSARLLPATYDHQPGLIGWSADGLQIFFTESRGTVTRIYAVAVATGEIAELNQGSDVIKSIDLNRSRTMFGFTLESPHQVPEAFTSSVERLKPVQVSHANAELPRLPLGKVEVVHWKSSDGLEIEGILTYPVGYEAGKRVPLLLQIHGGPMGVFLQGYQANPALYPNAVFAARGYAILQPNPRGSSGYGKQFRYANYKDWGGGDYRDIMSGVDHLIAMGVADPERLGVMGWSYGGYMTSWTITQTGRFKAASVGAGVTNLVSFTGTADIPSFLPDYLGAQPWDNITLYRERSATLHARGVTTPTLIQHGEADVRVPISQGYELYNALKQEGVPTRMLVLPRQPHGPNEPKMMLKIMQTNLEWFDKHLAAPSQVAAAGSNKPASTPTGAKTNADTGNLEEYVQAEMKKHLIPGLSLAVVKNGEVILAKGYGLANIELGVPATPETVYQLQSITKTFTATGVMMLVEEGKLDLEDKINKHLENLPDSWSEVTLRQLLSHTSGIKDFINEPTVNLRLDATPDEIMKSLADKPLNFPPGDKYRYSNTGYQLLGMIIHKVTGKEWGEFLRERIFEPLSMKATRVISVSDIIPNRAAGYRNAGGTLQNGGFVAPSILAYPGGGVRSTLQDLAKWDAALNGEKLVKQSTLEQMWTPTKLNDGSNAPYGLGWFVGNHQGHPFVLHTGSHVTGFGTVLARYRDDKITVIALTNQNGSNTSELAHGVADRFIPGTSKTAGTK